MLSGLLIVGLAAFAFLMLWATARFVGCFFRFTRAAERMASAIESLARTQQARENREHDEQRRI